MSLPPDRIDWKVERDRIDLAAVATRLLGPAPGRHGQRSRRLWWRCPFHDDSNPSFCVEPGKPWWKCFGCGESGDAATLVMRLENKSFPEALAELTGRPMPSGPRQPRATLRPPAAHEAPRRPEGMTEADAVALVESAAARLWTPEGAAARAYLEGRGLTDETIRAARLGWTPRAAGFPWNPPGVVIPWFDASGRLVFVKVRPDDAWRDALPAARRPPKYLAPRGWTPPRTLYPSPEAVRPGLPAVVVEGELDALLLGQFLGDRAAVVTLGAASSGRDRDGIDPGILVALSDAWPRYLAHDADEAGRLAADAWGAPRRRVRPPVGKDWTDCRAAGVDLARWWSDILAGIDRPPLVTRGHDEPGIDSRAPADPHDLAARLAESGAERDTYAVSERRAIQAESQCNSHAFKV